MSRKDKARYIYEITGKSNSNTVYRNFQEFYETAYSDYASKAYDALRQKDDWSEGVEIEIGSLETASGNPVLVDWSEKDIRMGLRMSSAEWQKQKKNWFDFINESIKKDFGDEEK